MIYLCNHRAGFAATSETKLADDYALGAAIRPSASESCCPPRLVDTLMADPRPPLAHRP